ncbi:MAG: hypothetical protein JNK73_05805 [Bacteroidia bacterium]|nr:hypothetical protein [Bacteroidia bacterium]
MTKKILTIIISLIVLYFIYDWFLGIDPNKPDSYGNRTFFKKTLKFESIPSDVSDIRCYSDHIGADFTDELSFECDSSTFKQIAATFDLKDKKDIPNFGRYLYKSLRKEIDTLNGLSDYKEKYSSPYHSFWYNPTNRHAYFLRFSL